MLGTHLLPHEADVRDREADHGERDQRDDVRPHEEQALVERQEGWDLLLCLGQLPGAWLGLRLR